MVDKDGNPIKMGDRVKFEYGEENISFVFTIEHVCDGWVWGSDIPDEHIYTGAGRINYHNTDFCVKVGYEKPWAGTVIKFNFI